MLALQAFTPEPLSQALGLTMAEARKIVAAVHRGDAPRPPPRGRAPGRDRRPLARSGHVPALEVRAVRPSAVDPFVKLALGTHDGHVIEAVRIPLERAGRFSACVSSQAGCALACAFCATGRLGLARNLETWEIVEQVRLVRGTLGRGERVHGVVFQGMGEPLANVDRVIEAIRVMSEPVRAGHRLPRHHRVHVGVAERDPAARARGAQGASRPLHRERALRGAPAPDAHRGRPPARRGRGRRRGARSDDGPRAHVGRDAARRRERHRRGRAPRSRR